ncbi:MAG: hypothetical protein ABFD90_20410 [Phycisphaerales bacterium]
MKSRFLAENRWLLRLCSNAARFVGLLALLGTGTLLALIVVVAKMSGSIGTWETLRDPLLAAPLILFYGFLALVFAEFISYLLADEGEPRWILRHGDKVIYAYIVYSLVMTVQVALRTSNTPEAGGIDYHSVLNLSLLIVGSVVQVLIWVGIGIVLHKVVPIIRESKTLV